MSEVKGQQEPSMEEILASIRRIIAEDNDTGKQAESVSAPPPAMPTFEPKPEPEPVVLKDDVLELTEVVEDESGEEFESPAVEKPEPYVPPRPSFVMPQDQAEGLVSKATAEASTAAFAAMTSRVRERRGGSGDIPLGNGAVTLEELVRDLLRPHLQEWLDDNLPGLVERLVREEVERLARGAK